MENELNRDEKDVYDSSEDKGIIITDLGGDNYEIIVGGEKVSKNRIELSEAELQQVRFNAESDKMFGLKNETIDSVERVVPTGKGIPDGGEFFHRSSGGAINSVDLPSQEVTFGGTHAPYTK